MRVVLVGHPDHRHRLRAQLDASMSIVAEFRTISDALASAVDVDAMLINLERSGSDRRFHAGIESHEGAEEPLTPRETEVLELLAQGLTNRSIARRLGISDQTVKFHVASISGKLGAVNRTDAVRRAVRRGLVTL